MSRHDRLTRTGAGVLVAGVAIFLVAALLSAAVYSASAANSVNGLVHHQLADANRQLDMLRANADASQARSDQAARERADLLNQNTALQREVDALVRYLRLHGIKVPVSVVNPPSTGAGPSNRPKVPAGHPPQSHPGGPGSPGPRPGTPSTGITDLCVLLPFIC